MTITRRSTLADVAAAVTGALEHAGITAVLTGGACATVYTGGLYQSRDLDFIIRRGGTRTSLDQAMATIGFTRDGDRYTHSATALFVEFPRGPLAIGDDVEITPVKLKLAGEMVTVLSPTDSCRDRLAAFYHWSDRQSLQVAVQIARARRVDMKKIREWSRKEGFGDRFEEFRSEIDRRRGESTLG